VKILSTDQKIASIPPISVFPRPLSDVISSALASNHIQAHDVSFEPQDSDKDTHGSPRVNKFTQESFYCMPVGWHAMAAVLTCPSDCSCAAFVPVRFY
jgi:hypothetical protein